MINNFIAYDNQNAGGIYRFYDESGDLIESGEILNYTGKYAESENFIMESYDYWTLSGTIEAYGIMNAFRTDLEKSVIPTSDNMYVCNISENEYASVKFKIPKKISKITIADVEDNIRKRTIEEDDIYDDVEDDIYDDNDDDLKDLVVIDEEELELEQ